MQRKLSVVVPVYNVEKYLNRCVESILSQSYSNIEIVLVDDGSPDECPEKCDLWAKQDHRVVVVHKENGGLSDARNAGIRVATGEYIAFVDSDDFIDTEMYSTMIEAMERTQSDISTCGRYMYDNEKGVKLVMHSLSSEKLFDSEKAVGELLCGGAIEESAWDKVFKKELFNGISFPVGEINEDITIMPKIVGRSSKVICVGKPFYYYCMNPNSITHKPFSEDKLVVKKHVEDVTEYILKKYPYMTKEVAIFRGRYAINQIFRFYKNEGLKKQYASFFDFYFSCIKENYWQLIKANTITVKKKMQITMMVLRVYEVYCKLK